MQRKRILFSDSQADEDYSLLQGAMYVRDNVLGNARDAFTV